MRCLLPLVTSQFLASRSSFLENFALEAASIWPWGWWLCYCWGGPRVTCSFIGSLFTWWLFVLINLLLVLLSMVCNLILWLWTWFLHYQQRRPQNRRIAMFACRKTMGINVQWSQKENHVSPSYTSLRPCCHWLLWRQSHQGWKMLWMQLSKNGIWNDIRKYVEIWESGCSKVTINSNKCNIMSRIARILLSTWIFFLLHFIDFN